MKHNLMSNLICQMIKLNPKDELSINKRKFYQSEIVKAISQKYEYNNKTKNKLYFFISSLLKLSNEVYTNNIQLIDVNNMDNIIFTNIKKSKMKNVEKLANIFVNFINYKIKYKDFINLIEIVSNINFDIYFGRYQKGENEYFFEAMGKEFYKYNLCDKINYMPMRLTYKLNNLGKKFLNNIYVSPTPKEIEHYNKLIDYNFMEKYMSALEHKKYFDTSLHKMSLLDRCVQVGRLHKGKFKKFFEEYYPLIEFVILRYGIETKMRFCGFDTNETIKCDGKVLINKREEKIEITCNFFDKKESYDGTVTLVVVLNNFYGMPNEKIADIEYLKKLFATLYERKYVFGSVYVLVDEYNGHDMKILPRLIKIK